MSAHAVTPVTPDAVFLGHLAPGTPEWDAARAGLCITATEIAAVMGLSPWQSRFSLWHKKAGRSGPGGSASTAMRWGVRLEDDVEDEFAAQHPEWLPTAAGTWQNRDRPWQRATPDRLLFPCTPDAAFDGATAVAGEPTALLEIKTSPFGDDWADGLPVHYRAQVLWQLDTLGLQHAHVALLIGAGWEYREFVVEYDPDDVELLRAEAAAFLASVERGERPAIDSSTATYQTVRAQPAGREDIDVEVPAALADRYEQAHAAKRSAEAEYRQAAAALLDAIGGGRWAVCDGRRVAQRTVRDGRTHSLIPSQKKGPS